MKKLSSRTVSIVGTATLALALTGLACADGGDETQTVNTEYGEICVRHDYATGDDIRVDDAECEQGRPGTSTVWVNQAHGHRSPAIGQRLAPGTATWARPATGSFAKPPATGGFGTHTVSVGS